MCTQSTDETLLVEIFLHSFCSRVAGEELLEFLPILVAAVSNIFAVVALSVCILLIVKIVD